MKNPTLFILATLLLLECALGSRLMQTRCVTIPAAVTPGGGTTEGVRRLQEVICDYSPIVASGNNSCIAD